MSTDVLDLYAKVKFDSSDFNAGLNQAESSFSAFGDKIKSGVAAAAKITAGAVAAGAAAVGSLVKQSMDSFGEFEQLSGGIDKLFGDSANQLKQYADEAYKTTGMSANDYMQSATQFSASLIKSLGGDTAAAAEMANLALKDIADNANTFGAASAEELTNVYKNLARGQFQTLDNLNLGYAGTKEGMEQLIADANALAAANGKAADYSIDSFSDMIQAIHDVQENMNITGTTANEAAGTIQGSVGTMKAAWENLLTGFATGDTGKMQNLVDYFLASGADVLSNVKPRVKIILDSIGKVITQYAPKVFDAVPAMIADMLPEAAGAIGGLLSSVGGAIWNGAPMLLNAGKDLVLQLMDGVQEQAGNILPAAVEAVGEIATALTSPESLNSIIASGISIISSLAGGLIDSIPALVDTSFQVISNLSDLFIANAPMMITTAAELMLKLGEGLTKAVGKILDKVPDIMKDLQETLNDGDSIRRVFEAAAEIMRKLGTGLVDNIMAIGEKIPEVVESIKRFFLDTNWLDVGRQILEGILSGFLDVDFNISEYLSDFKDNFVTGVKDIFGIHSPSQLMADEVGKYLALGVGEGFDENLMTSLPKPRRVQEYVKLNAERIAPSTAAMIERESSTTNNTNNMTINITVEGGFISDEHTAEALARRIGEKLSSQSIRVLRAVGGTGWN